MISNPLQRRISLGFISVNEMGFKGCENDNEGWLPVPVVSLVVHQDLMANKSQPPKSFAYTLVS
jgi:hypothetical protein